MAIDQLTKWVEARAISNLSALITASFILEQVIFRHGSPHNILSDNGTNFTLHVLPRLNQLMGIKGTLSTPYHPQANGMVERANGSLVCILLKLSHRHPSEWDTYQHAANFSYNIGFYSAIGYSPFRLLYGRQPDLLPHLYGLHKKSDAVSLNQYLAQLAQTLIKIQSEAYFVNLNAKQKDIDCIASRCPPLPSYQISNSVYFYSNCGYGRESKLASLWQGPIKVVQQVGPDTYTLKDPSTGQLVTRMHASYMRAAPGKLL